MVAMEQVGMSFCGMGFCVGWRGRGNYSGNINYKVIPKVNASVMVVLKRWVNTYTGGCVSLWKNWGNNFYNINNNEIPKVIASVKVAIKEMNTCNNKVLVVYGYELAQLRL